MYLRLGLHDHIRLYYVLPYKAKVSAQHGIGFILDRCIMYFGLTIPNLQKKRLLIFEIFNIKKCTLFFGTGYIITVFRTVTFDSIRTVDDIKSSFRQGRTRSDIFEDRAV